MKKINFSTKIFRIITEITLFERIEKKSKELTFLDIKINSGIFNSNSGFEFRFELLNMNNRVGIYLEKNTEQKEGEETQIFATSEIERYVTLGIDQSKIITTFLPSVVVWSITRNKIVSGPDCFETIKNEDGNLTLSVDNNRLVSLLCYTNISDDLIQEINKSKGIIITDQHREGVYKFGIIPDN
jgi:hypothetical protein